MALLLAKKIIIITKCLDFRNIFFKNIAVKLFKYFNINKYLINLKAGE